MAIKNHSSNTGSWARYVVVIAALSAMTGLLSACGGSGAASTTPITPPTPPTPPVIALAVLPSTADVFADLPADFSVSGGTAPYTAGSSNPVVVPAPAVVGSTASGFKLTVIAKSAAMDTSVVITIRDAVGATVPLTLNVRATTLSNTLTITPIGPTGTGCSGLCSGGDAAVAVTAIQNGVRLINRPIRFDVVQGDFRFVTPGTNVLVTSIVVNTDESGIARARITAIVTAPTQVAIISTTDTVTGLVLKTNFVIAQQVSGVGILSVLPAGPVTFTGSRPGAGQPAQCPFGGIIDHYIFGGTPPYTVVSPLPQFLSVFPSVVTTNGGSYRVTQSGCGSGTLVITDTQNRAIESPSVVGVLGPAGDSLPPPTPTTLVVTPSGGGAATPPTPDHTLTTCSDVRTSTTSGSGTFTTTATSPGVVTVAPAAGTIGAGISFTRSAGTLVTPTFVTVNVVAGAITRSVFISVTGPPVCP